MSGIELSTRLLLAEAAGDAAANGADAAASTNPLNNMLLPLAIIFGLFYLLILRPQRAKDQQFKALVENLKETDRVVTIGGIHGVVTNVQRNPDGVIVTLRVDEATGAKIRVGASAIARVITEDEKSP